MAAITRGWITLGTAHPLPTEPTMPPAKPPLVADYALLLTGISCLASIFGCVVIFVTFFRFPEYRTSSRKLLLYLTIADIFTAAGNLVGIVRYYIVFKVNGSVVSDCDNHSIVCRAQSYVTTVSNLSSFFWMCVISVYFIVAVVKSTETAERIMVPSHVICWGLPVIIVSVALGYNVLGEDLSYTSGGWCWITECRQLSRGTKLAWMLATGKFWEFATYITLIINYALLKFVVWMRGVQGTVPQGGLSHNDSMFVFVPIILLVLRIWGTVKFILSSSYVGVTVVDDGVYTGQEVLTALQGIGDSGQGFWNFILFCVLTKEIRKKVFSWRRVADNLYVAVDDDPLGGDSSSSSDDDEPISLSSRSPHSSLASNAGGHGPSSRSPLTSLASNASGYNSMNRNHVT